MFFCHKENTPRPSPYFVFITAIYFSTLTLVASADVINTNDYTHISEITSQLSMRRPKLRDPLCIYKTVQRNSHAAITGAQMSLLHIDEHGDGALSGYVNYTILAPYTRDGRCLSRPEWRALDGARPIPECDEYEQITGVKKELAQRVEFSCSSRHPKSNSTTSALQSACTPLPNGNQLCTKTSQGSEVAYFINFAENNIQYLTTVYILVDRSNPYGQYGLTPERNLPLPCTSVTKEFFATHGVLTCHSRVHKELIDLNGQPHSGWCTDFDFSNYSLGFFVCNDRYYSNYYVHRTGYGFTHKSPKTFLDINIDRSRRCAKISFENGVRGPYLICNNSTMYPHILEEVPDYGLMFPDYGGTADTYKWKKLNTLYYQSHGIFLAQNEDSQHIHAYFLESEPSDQPTISGLPLQRSFHEQHGILCDHFTPLTKSNFVCSVDDVLSVYSNPSKTALDPAGSVPALISTLQCSEWKNYDPYIACKKSFLWDLYKIEGTSLTGVDSWCTGVSRSNDGVVCNGMINNSTFH